MAGNVVRKVYLYDDLSTSQERQDDGTYLTRQADTAGALAYIHTLPHDDECNPNAYMPLERDETVASVLIFGIDPDYVAGIFGRKRKNGLPLYENSGLLYTKDISAKEGLYEGAHFVYFRETRQLMLERSRYAPRKLHCPSPLVETMDFSPRLSVSIKV